MTFGGGEMTGGEMTMGRNDRSCRESSPRIPLFPGGLDSPK